MHRHPHSHSHAHAHAPQPEPPSSPVSLGSAPTRQVSKRKQVKNACVNCQRACKKCDDVRPCTRCVKYGIADSCIDSQRKERSRKSISHGAPLEAPTARPLPLTPRLTPQLPKMQTAAPLRTSSRTTRQPLTKELIAALQQAEHDDDGPDTDDGPEPPVPFHAHHHLHPYHLHTDCEPPASPSPRQHKPHPSAPVPAPPDAQPPTSPALHHVSEEFRALAQLCSDIHQSIQSTLSASALQQPPPDPRGAPASYFVRSPMPSSPTAAPAVPNQRVLMHPGFKPRPFGAYQHVYNGANGGSCFYSYTPAIHPALYPVQHFRRSPLPFPLKPQPHLHQRLVFNQTPPEDSLQPLPK